MRRSVVLLALLATPACSTGSGSVTVEGIDDFGSVSSTTWTVIQPVHLWLAGDSGAATDLGEISFDALALRDYAWSCADQQDYIARWGELSAAVLDAEGDAWCDAMTELDDHFSTGPSSYHSFSASGAVNGELPAPGPVSGTYGYLSYNEDDGSACPTWDADACALTGGEASCGSEDQAWFVEPSAFTIESADEEEVVGSLEGELTLATVDSTDAPAGTISVEFQAATCTVDRVPALVLTH